MAYVDRVVRLVEADRLVRPRHDMWGRGLNCAYVSIFNLSFHLGFVACEYHIHFLQLRGQLVLFVTNVTSSAAASVACPAVLIVAEQVLLVVIVSFSELLGCFVVHPAFSDRVSWRRAVRLESLTWFVHYPFKLCDGVITLLAPPLPFSLASSAAAVLALGSKLGLYIVVAGAPMLATAVAPRLAMLVFHIGRAEITERLIFVWRAYTVVWI